MDDKQFAFHLEEYKFLKDEILSLVKETRYLETLALGGTGGVYAWLAVNSTKQIATIGWWIPVLFPVFAILRQVALLSRIMHIAEYIRAIEKEICENQLPGWETFLQEKRKKVFPSLLISISAFMFWIVLLLISIWVGHKFG